MDGSPRNTTPEFLEIRLDIDGRSQTIIKTRERIQSIDLPYSADIRLPSEAMYTDPSGERRLVTALAKTEDHILIRSNGPGLVYEQTVASSQLTFRRYEALIETRIALQAFNPENDNPLPNNYPYALPAISTQNINDVHLEKGQMVYIKEDDEPWSIVSSFVSVYGNHVMYHISRDSEKMLIAGSKLQIKPPMKGRLSKPNGERLQVNILGKPLSEPKYTIELVAKIKNPDLPIPNYSL